MASKIQLQQLSTETDDFCPQEFYDDLAELMTDGIGDGDTSVQSRHTQQHEMKFENLCCANYVPLSTHLSANSFTKHGECLITDLLTLDPLKDVCLWVKVSEKSGHILIYGLSRFVP